MDPYRYRSAVAGLGVALLLAGCASSRPPPAPPAADAPLVLVLPLINNAGTDAASQCAGEFAPGLARLGYRTIAVGAGDARPPDVAAVFQPVIERYGDRYAFVDSNLAVTVSARLTQPASGGLLWSGTGTANRSTATGDPVQQVMGAAVGSVLNRVHDAARKLCDDAVLMLLTAPDNPLPTLKAASAAAGTAAP